MPRAFEPKARLGWQQEDGGFVFSPKAGPNRLAADALVEHLRSMRHLEEIDGAQVQAMVMLAESVDADPTNASLWGQYRAAELQLRGVTERGKESAFDALLQDLAAGDPAVSDTKVAKSADARGAGRKGVQGARAAVDGASAVDRRRRGGAAS
jgi:hypothetical protein